jgi:hypothetical protein
MLHKHNTERRHHIPKMQFRVPNWTEYEAGLRRRGSLTLWVTAGEVVKPRLQPTEPRMPARTMGDPPMTDAAVSTSPTGHRFIFCRLVPLRE